MGGTALKVLIAGFFVWLSAQMGTFADEILTKVRESVQASELLTIDQYVYYHAGFEADASSSKSRFAKTPKNQAEFEAVLRDWTEAPGGRDVTRDRWDRPYIYDKVDTADPRRICYRIASSGPDKVPGTADDIVVEREDDRSHINKDPTKIAEDAIERKKRLDREVAAKVREILEVARREGKQDPAGAKNAKDVSPERQSRELDDATHELGRLLED